MTNAVRINAVGSSTSPSGKRAHRTGRTWPHCLAIALVGVAIVPYGQVHAAAAMVSKVVGGVIAIRDGEAGKLAVMPGMPLNDADQLQGLAADSAMELECTNGAVQTLAGKFDALINATGADTACTIDLNEGTAVATTAVLANGDEIKDSASIRRGPVAMVSHHTQFGMAVVRHEGDSPAANSADGFVLDGEAICRDASNGKTWIIQTGKQISLATKKLTPVDAASYERVAHTFARLDLSRPGKEADPALLSQLQSRWLGVMQRPQDAVARVELAEAQASAGLSSSRIAAYQGTRANALALKVGNVALQDRAQRITDKSRFRSEVTSGVASESQVAPQPLPQSQVVTQNQVATQPQVSNHAIAAQLAVAQRTFSRPMQGGMRVDWCLHWGVDCGQSAADAWCRKQGLHRASSFTMEADIGAASPTLVLGDNKACHDASCDGFASVTCQ